MEILYEYTVPDYNPLGLILVGVVIITTILGIVLYFIDYFDDHDKGMLAWGIGLSVLLVLMIIGAVELCQESTQYTVARIPDTVAYKDIIETWKYVSHEGDIYKLIAR